ncbi:MAG: hypothetical protein OQK54_00120 [Gammaproteobacteria bacterium]|nr:hypothetical protein [Gammaproteobacteria bacterium]
MAEGTGERVEYNRQADTLSLSAEQRSLKEILGKIAIQSQLEVLFDERADRQVTMTFEDRPLEDGLKNLLSASNYAFRYTKDETGKLLLIGVHVLPEGSSDPSLAQPLLHVAGEAFMNAKHNYQMPQQESALFNKRWQARLAEMSPEIQKKVTEKAQERIADLEAKRKARQARSEEKKAEREAKRAEQSAKRPTQGKHPEEMNLEERTAHEQRLRNVQQMLEREY